VQQATKSAGAQFSVMNPRALLKWFEGENLGYSFELGFSILLPSKIRPIGLSRRNA
jgi:hypothetical protein